MLSLKGLFNNVQIPEYSLICVACCICVGVLPRIHQASLFAIRIFSHFIAEYS